jgi:pimeloyl-ACP methyl ester carboxylesterase
MVRFLERNGIRLAYETTESASSSATTIVLIHGWADRHELLAPMAKHFRSRYRVLSVDLRGHGQSDKPKTGYSIPTLADDVAYLCQKLGRKNVVLVGHSLGGAVVLETAARHPALASSIVAIEGALLFPAPVREGFKPMGEALRGPGWKKAMREFTDSVYLPNDDPALRQYSYRELDRLPQHVHIGVYEAVMNWDAEQAARACRCPLLYIEGGSGLTDLARLKILCPRLIVGQAVGVSHLAIVGSPEQSLAMIDRFLQIGGRK